MQFVNFYGFVLMSLKGSTMINMAWFLH